MTGRIAILFPGQGSQYVGMLNQLILKSPKTREIVKRADAILGYKLSEMIANGPEEMLSRTEFTQPATVLTSLCHWEAIKERFQGRELVMAGHSIGEYSALAAAGWLSMENIMQLVALRGRIMSETDANGVMTVVNLGRPEELVEIQQRIKENLDESLGSCSAFNSSVQLVISGAESEVEKIEDLLSQIPKIMMMMQRLKKVSCAFHSPLMQRAAKRFRNEARSLLLQTVNFKSSTTPVISNVTAEPHKNADCLLDLLCEQITAPVRWHDTIQNVIRSGCSHLVTMPPGRVLQGLLRRDPIIPKTILIEEFTL
jgi:[acyl-carrier-protein] S-malonyltransferase